MSCQEAEALCLLGKEHLAQVAVTQANLTVFSNRAGDAERLKTDTDCSSSVSSLNTALLDSNSAAYSVSPNCVFKADRLSFSYDLIAVDTLSKCDFLALFD